MQDHAALQDEAQRQWRALPTERGPVLYLLSQIEQEHYGSVGRVITRMCDERATGDLAQLHAWTLARAASRASEQRDLEPIAYRTTPGRCAER